MRKEWGGGGERDEKTVKERERESLSDQGSQREDFILFYSMFPFLGSFPLRLAPLLVRAPHPQGRFGCLPRLDSSFYLSCLQQWGGGLWAPKLRDLPGSQKQTAICLGSEVGGHPGTSPCPAKPHFHPTPSFLRGDGDDGAYHPEQSQAGCRTQSARTSREVIAGGIWHPSMEQLWGGGGRRLGWLGIRTSLEIGEVWARGGEIRVKTTHFAFLEASPTSTSNPLPGVQSHPPPPGLLPCLPHPHPALPRCPLRVSDARSSLSV